MVTLVDLLFKEKSIAAFGENRGSEHAIPTPRRQRFGPAVSYASDPFEPGESHSRVSKY
jgi:hypothetical protein